MKIPVSPLLQKRIHLIIKRSRLTYESQSSERVKLHPHQPIVDPSELMYAEDGASRSPLRVFRLAWDTSWELKSLCTYYIRQHFLFPKEPSWNQCSTAVLLV